MQRCSRQFLNFARRFGTAGVLLSATLASLTLFSSTLAYAAPAAKPLAAPHSAWFTLGASTLDEGAVGFTTFRAIANDATLWDKLPRDGTKSAAIIVPILSGGRVLYPTVIAPFAERNAEAREDEAALRALLGEAKKHGVAVYLGFDALGWQRPADAAWQGAAAPALFEGAPELEELTKDLVPPASGPRFASPWAPSVEESLKALVGEAVARFPDAAGAVLDVHLGRGDISGFNARARLAARRDLKFDPTTLELKGTADETLSPNAQKWVAWRGQKLEALLGTLVQSVRARQPGDEVWIWGEAGYESVSGFDAVRSGQDWARWMRDLPLTGVLLEGRWSEGDAARLVLQSQSRIVPVVRARGETASAGAEWGALGGSKRWAELGFVVASTREMNEAFALARGQVPQRTLEPLQTNSVLPEVRLPAADGSLWSPRAARGKLALALLVANFPQQTKSDTRRLSTATREMASAKAQLGVRGVQAVVVSAAPAEFAMTPGSETLQQVSDAGRALLARCPAGLSLVGVDSAGWVRALTPLTEPETASALALKTIYKPTFEVGQPAPDFTIRDMNGQERRLSDLRGKKALLLSFFPKCFTGGCANHMASLDGQFETFARNDIEVLGVSIDPADVQREFAERWKLRFALVPDTGRQLCFLYDAVSTVDDLATRQTVFIDKNGVVAWIDKSVNVASHGRDVEQRLRADGLLRDG